MTASEAVELIQSLEPVFFEAGQLAVDLQQQAIASMKSDTGNVGSDIVTSADLEVQEFLLTRLAATALRDCRLLAEEHTPTTDAFNPAGTIDLTVDPISGTIRYAAGKPMFTQKVGLRRGSTFLYTFVRHPAVDWTVITIDGRCTVRGASPRIPLPANANQLILTVNKPEQCSQDDAALAQQLTTEGYEVHNQRDVTEEASASSLLLAGQIGGYYAHNPNVYDGWTTYTFALAHDLELHSTVAWDQVIGEPGDLRHPGYYVALNRPENRIDNV